MKKIRMKSTFLIPLLLAAEMLCADSSSLTIDPPSSEFLKNRHVYFDLGTMYILPQLGVGFRQQNGYWGYDLALKGSAIPLAIGCGPMGQSAVWLPWVSGGARLLYYPKPNLESQWYIGAGVTSPYFAMVWPNLVFGKSYQKATEKNQFWQIGTDLILDSSVPVVSFSYGFCL